MPISGAAKELFRVVNRNVKRRLRALEVTAYEASKRFGQRPGWITDTLRRRGRVSLSTLADLAECLGMDPAALCDPNGEVYGDEPGHWEDR